MPVALSHVNQSGAHADGDNVGGNKITNNQITNNYLPPSAPMGLIEKMMERLSAEIRDNHQVQELIGSLQFFYIQKTKDGVVGLEAKLIKAGRDDELLYALEKKELFVKLLDRYSLYESAQRIFAHLLAKTEHEFSQVIHPQIANLNRSEVNGIVSARIVEPIVQECGMGPLDINHSVVMGMIYWLAEQCFIRWHQ
jgi:hypothetical protein